MADKTIDLLDLAKLPVEDYAQEFGRQLPERLQKLEDWLKSNNHAFASTLVEQAKKLLNDMPSWLTKSVAGVVNIPRHVLPAGVIGDVMHKYGNDIVDEIGRGLSEKAKAGATGNSGTGGDWLKKPYHRLDLGQPVYIIEGSPYPINCSHRQPPFRKGEGKPMPVTLAEAIRRHHLPHDICFGTSDEIGALIASMHQPPTTNVQQTATPAASDPEPTKEDQVNELPKADHTLFDLWVQLGDENPMVHGPLRSEFNGLKSSDPDLHAKFVEAFHRRGTYEQFKQLVTGSPSHEWGISLDNLLGRTKKPESFLERETRENNQAIDVGSKFARGIASDIEAWSVKRQKAHEKKQTERLAKMAKQARFRTVFLACLALAIIACLILTLTQN
jgi:hypothetical protein